MSRYPAPWKPAFWDASRVDELRRSVDNPTDILVRRLRRAALGILALGIAAFLIVGANRPANPRLVPPKARAAAVGSSGFGTASFSVKPGAGLTAPKHALCALLARTPAQQAQGLMGQTSLHRFSGMIFAFSPPNDAVFYMKDTTLPLSVAWFDSSGAYLAGADMPPCPPAERICPTYRAGRPEAVALEVERGRLASFGIGPGSSIQLGGAC